MDKIIEECEKETSKMPIGFNELRLTIISVNKKLRENPQIIEHQIRKIYWYIDNIMKVQNKSHGNWSVQKDRRTKR